MKRLIIKGLLIGIIIHFSVSVIPMKSLFAEESKFRIVLQCICQTSPKSWEICGGRWAYIVKAESIEEAIIKAKREYINSLVKGKKCPKRIFKVIKAEPAD